MSIPRIGIAALALVVGAHSAMGASSEAQPGLRVGHYTLEVSFDPAAQTVSGTSTLKLSWQRSPPGGIAIDMAPSTCRLAGPRTSC